MPEIVTIQEEGELFYFTCCGWDKLTPESKKAVEQLARAAAGQLTDSPLTDKERQEYDAAWQSIIEARSAQPKREKQAALDTLEDSE